MIISDTIKIIKNGVGPGVDCRKMGVPRTINYAGSPGDQIDFVVSNDGDRYGSVGLVGTANPIGQFVLVVEPLFAFVAAAKKAGQGGYCAISAVQTGENPTLLLPTGFAGIAGPWVDCRDLNVPRTLLYLGTGGDTVLIEGSNDGDSAYRIYERGLFSDTTGFIIADLRQAASYVRATQRGAKNPQVSLSSTAPISFVMPSFLSIDDTLANGPLGGLSAKDLGKASTLLVTQNTANVFASLPVPSGINPVLLNVVLMPASKAGQLVVEGIKIPLGGAKTFVWAGSFWAPTV